MLAREREEVIELKLIVRLSVADFLKTDAPRALVARSPVSSPPIAGSVAERHAADARKGLEADYGERAAAHFASILIAKRHDPVFVSRQLGHANAAITVKVYAHLFVERDALQPRTAGRRSR